MSREGTFTLKDVAKRPQHGVRGDQIALLTNLYRLNMNSFRVRKYRVELSEITTKMILNKKTGNRFSKETAKPIKDRNEKRELFWYIVRRRTDVFKYCENIVFDDFEFAWALDPAQPNGNPNEFTLESEEHPDKLNVKVKLYVCKMIDFDVRLDGIDPFESSMFMKNLITQRTRFPPERTPSQSSDAEDAHLTFYKQFTTWNGTVFRVPRTLQYPQKVFVSSGVRAWIGLYANIRAMEDNHPVVNFGLVNNLFIEMNMSLFTFWADMCQEVYPSTLTLSDAELEKMSMNKQRRGEMVERLKGIKLKCEKACLWDSDNQRYFLGERHYRLEALADNEFRPTAPQASAAAGRGRGGFRGRGGGCPPTRDFEELRYRTFGPTANRLMLDMGDGKIISLADFYGINGCKLKLPNLPLCVVQIGKKLNYVPMEVLFTHDSPQVYRRALDFDTKMKYIKSVTRDAKLHKKLTNGLISKMNLTDDPFLKEFNIEVDPSNVECMGRVMDAPFVRQGAPSTPVEDELKRNDILEPHSYYRGFKLGPFLQKPPRPLDFVIINVNDPECPEPGNSTAVERSDLNKFFQSLCAVLRERHVVLERKKAQMTAEWAPGKIPFSVLIRELVEEYKNFMLSQPSGPPTDLFFLIFSKRRFNVYAEIKQTLDVKFQLPNQVVNEVTVRKAVAGKNSVYYNISMKINAKLGGVTHALSAEHIVAQIPMAMSGLAFMSKDHATMFIGIDVTHPSPNSGYDGISIAAMVASVNLDASKYQHSLLAQMMAKETILNFNREHLEHLVTEFHRTTQTYPKHVVIFRDGVSNGELMNTTSKELGWIKSVWNTLKVTDDLVGNPTFTFIIVQKRHLVRFYKKNDSDFPDPDPTIDAHNVPSGTAVDSEVVSPEVYDFYLASQHGAIGTTRPARYIVMYDEWNLGADQLQEMCYYLCFLYARCAHPVSLPTPLYYAHLACDKAKEYYKALVRKDELPARLAPRERPDEEFVEKALIEHNIQPYNFGLPFV